jgi:curved DNA-binding protein CbpA
MGLSPDGPLDNSALRQRYLELALLVHPDKHACTSRVDAEVGFKRLSKAYEELSEPPSDSHTRKRSSPTSDGDFGRKRRKGPASQKASRRRNWCGLSYEEVAKEIERLSEQVLLQRVENTCI